MQITFTEADNIFNFKGLWDIPSKCGLKIFNKNNRTIVIASELYQNNPGTSVTQAACTLLDQICDFYKIDKTKIVYIQHNPEMNSKLSFYEEEFYFVEVEIKEEKFINPRFIKLSKEERKKIYENT